MLYFRTLGHFNVYGRPSTKAGRTENNRIQSHLRPSYGARDGQDIPKGTVIAECGTGKTLISLGAVQTHAEEQPFTALAMVPPQLCEKWARESLLTLPRVRVFLIDGQRTPTSAKGHYGVNEVKLRSGRIVREGLHTSLTDLRLRKTSPSARQRWGELCRWPAVFVVGRDRAKLGYFWRHAYQIACSGRYRGCAVNSDSGAPVYLNEDGERLLGIDFKKAKLSEVLGCAEEADHTRRQLYSALWQADGTKTRRFAPIEFIGRYMPDFFDYAIGDEVHELKGGDTAQGNALGTLASCADRIAVLTGTLLGGYAADRLSRELPRILVGWEGVGTAVVLVCFAFFLSFSFAVSGGFWRLTKGGRSPTGVSCQKPPETAKEPP